MKRMLIASLVAVGCSVSLAAQAPTGTTKPQSPTTTKEQPATQKPSQADDKSAVVRGCLRAGDQTGTYVLSNATATSGGTLKNATVQLVGSPSGMNLKEHVGHTVEATGMLTPGATKSGTGTTGAEPTKPGAGAEPTKPGAGAGTGKPGAASTAATAKLSVKSVKHVKEGC